MTRPEESRAETLKRLDEQADALESRNAETPQDPGYQAMSYGYRLLAEMIGGVLVGLAVGWVFDYFVGSAPAGIIVGTLLGFGVSIWMAMRSAKRLGDKMSKDWGPPVDLPDDADENEDR